ncbi:sensor histidine kinase [Microbacterium halotolerans]|uniref:sensor histidine kinase n=1 Tax=Microbacterium halotolerans TaxID=246613 RepID=UPI000E6AB0D8|nr:sensor histidine kinase [Microbacterium halotolerans]
MADVSEATAAVGGGAHARRGDAVDRHDQRDPWARFAWVLGVVWVVFMLFPISAASEAAVSEPRRAIGTALLIAYALAYIVVYMWMIRSETWSIASRRGCVGLAVMVALMAAASVLVGPGALGAGAFLISIAMFSGTVRRAIPLAVALLLAQYLLLTVVLALTPDGFIEYAVLYMPPAIVFVSTGIIRLINAAQEQHDVVERQTALVAERERVARDVHDVLGHSLTIVTVKSELAERLVDIDPDRAKAELAQIRSLSREALAEVRATVSGLRVARLGDELVAADEALRAAGIESAVPKEADAVDPRYRIVVAWVLREAITNVVRHSYARRCSVRLYADGIVIEDDGKGVPSGVAAGGLRGARERVEAAGARLEVGAANDDGAECGPGTRVEVRW